MATSIVSVSFSNGFIGDASKTNESSFSTYLTALGWSNFQFQQATTTGLFGGSQGNDLSGTILLTDALGVQHRIDGVINWRAPSGDVSTMVFYATGSTNHTLATTGGGFKVIDPNTEANGDAHSFIGLTFNGQSLAISGGKVSGNAATTGLLASLNEYLLAQPQLSLADVSANEAAGFATITVSLSKATTDTVTVKYSLQDGSAHAGADYAAGGGTLTFAPNETTKTIHVPLVDNASVDGVRNLSVVLSDSTFAAIVDNVGVVTISDNDSGVVVSAVTVDDSAHPAQSPADSTVAEGGTLVFTVTLNSGAPVATEFALALGGTATAADYSSLVFSDGVSWKDGDQAGGIVVVPANVTSFTVTAVTVDDALVESAETLELTTGGVAATGTIDDNDMIVIVPPPVMPPPVVPEPVPEPEPEPEPVPPVPVAPVPAPVPEPAPEPAPKPTPKPVPPVKPVPLPAPPAPPVLETGLDPKSDDGSSNSDTVTSVRDPAFTLKGSGLLVEGGSVRLLSPSGEVVGKAAVTAADILSGAVNVGPGPLDDGIYTFTAQILSASGAVLGQAPVSVTIVTDLDGVAPSVELAAYNGDYNGDGILDWQQNSVAHMPLASLADFELGKAAPLSSFGAVIAGSIGTATDAVQLTGGAQLKDLFLSGLPAALPGAFRAASPVFNFTISPEDDVAALPDLAPERAGLQTRVVIDLGASGVVSNDFVKFDQASQAWYSFLDDQDLSTMDDGATLVDLNGDGRVDRIVLTLTDGARGDDDGIVNGVIVDPGLLAFDVTPPDQVYSIRLASGEIYYTDDIADARQTAAGAGNIFTGVAFDSMHGSPGGKHVSSFYQPFTRDVTFAVDGDALPYACYELVATSPGFMAAAAGSAAVDIHLYQNARGLTELVSAAEAQYMGLAAQGYADRGAKFSVSVDNAFRFDVEGYLIANHDNAAVKALVAQLAAAYQSTGQAGFIEAVEQNYFQQIQLVGVAHGASATASDLNAVFGTTFGN
ncbi:Calx-beta domain-containing protein [Massilia sp. GCM10020059]|uniref:Ig-like domain-containing protein n=1 Tax=Massilia agrisoli TaxID=2892444 RepID=A0ABS8IWA6_9BURK|nr:Calx-beta domain-containing protein [Massilia agrisoli]MCC6071968.1 Ig-like domain-containing protein [Massilia agrisoli]